MKINKKINNTDDKRVKMSTRMSSLQITMKDVKRSDSAIYNLSLTNSVGSNKYALQVTVLGEILEFLLITFSFANNIFIRKLFKKMFFISIKK